MATLDLFPARVQFVDSNGRLTPEAYRAMNALFLRTGGALGDLGEDVFGVFSASDIQENQKSDFSVFQQPQEQKQEYQDVLQNTALQQVFDISVFQQESKGGAIQSVSVSASPFSYSAISDGFVSISGGTVSLVQLTRGSVTINAGVTAGIIPVNFGDVVKITYTVSPTVYFVPR